MSNLAPGRSTTSLGVSLQHKLERHTFVLMNNMKPLFTICVTAIVLLLMLNIESTFSFSQHTKQLSRLVSLSTTRRQQQPKQSYSVQVSYEGRSCSIDVERDETILTAMERAGAPDTLGVPSLPYDCRKGNCLTCTGRHTPQSNPLSLATTMDTSDGLSPHMSHQVNTAGYVLTCCATVVGPGVQLNLGKNEEAWKMMHQTRLQDDEATQIHQQSLARVMRLRAEQNIPRWTKVTEKVFKKT